MTWLDILKILVPVVVVVVGWLFNEHSKMQWDRYKRKEDRYVALLDSLKGFYVSTNPATAKDQKDEFIRQLNLCWLYCPDSILRAGYHFLDQVTVDARKSNEEKEEALGALVLQARNDLFAEKPWPWFSKRTRMTTSDFRHLRGV